ncbi:MAG: hypothetical protein F2876_11105 [Actinobacteria bacterium]|nr:hypothetical protein [Actinomycetota bacterium]
MAFRQLHRVRYVECDMQGVMHNSQYLAVIDDAVDVWTHPVLEQCIASGWDFMVKRVDIVWHGPARHADVLQLELDVRRWGTSSFEVGVEAIVLADGLRCVSATVTYVGVDLENRRAAAVPGFVRAHLS